MFASNTRELANGNYQVFLVGLVPPETDGGARARPTPRHNLSRLGRRAWPPASPAPRSGGAGGSGVSVSL